MKKSHSIILIVLLVVAILAVSGCTGGSSTTNPTATPSHGGSSTPAPTQPGSNTPGSLFNLGNLKMYEYKLTTVSGGETTSSTYKIEYSDSTYQGTPAKLSKFTYSMPSTGQMVVSLYYSKTDDHLLGGTYTMNAGGQTFEFPIGADEGDTYSENDWASSTADDFDDMSGWTSAGSETLSANGRSYNCAKHTWTYGSTSYTIWTNDQAPMPMKYHWVDNQGNSWTMELLSWS
ncbi:MAG: hypothetical protein A4E28_03089 [Methanocella sp. PtaU1.Bin125]|nr:MAG: hypothetical protein A4E28_03089 [Methanocella sp. PtaU1.Bin125]